MEKDLEIKDIKGFIKRRKKVFSITVFAIIICGFVLAIALPPVYKSDATIRLEDQQIPEDFVKQPVKEFAVERIERISQQVLSRPKLLEIVNSFDLYRDIKSDKSDSELASKLRGNILLETITADLSSTKGHTSYITVAFNISFEGENPETVKKVTEMLSNLYLEEDIKSREKMVKGTTKFFENELKRLKDEIKLQEEKISQFKKKHLRELPSDRGYNLQAIARLERVMDQVDLRLRVLEEKKLLLDSQLATVKPMAPVMVDGKDINTDPEQRLRELHFELANLRTTYSERHPDIKILKREIAKLENEIASSGDSNVNMKLVAEKADNPAYINLKTQIETIQMETKALQEEKDQLAHELDVYQQRIEVTPYVEKDLNALTRDYDNSKNSYAELSNKLMNAKIVQGMEGEQKGERFSITSPAYLPQKPYKPNRAAIILFSLLIAVGLSSALVVVQESVDDTIKTSSNLKELSGVPVLASVSYILTDQDKRSSRFKRIGWTCITIFILGAVLYCVDKYLIKFEQLWTFILDRLQMIA